jgi:RimJ/RimL family protein N-acetyltransferase
MLGWRLMSAAVTGVPTAPAATTAAVPPAVSAEEGLSLPELRGDGLLLRPLRDSDAADRRACGFNAEFERMLGHDAPVSAEMTKEVAQSWLRGRRGMPMCWAIDVDGRCAGTVGFVSMSLRSGWAALAVEIFDPALWNRGLGSEAIRLVLGHGFGAVGLHRIELQVLSYNERAIRAYEKCGFVREGVVRECRRVNGEWIDDLSMSILDREYWAVTSTRP